MKKISILICTLLLITANAQKKGVRKTSTKTTQKTVSKTPPSASKKIQFGVRAGANLAKITGNDTDQIFNEKIGYFGGIVVKYPIANKINIQGETYYNLIGTASKNKNDFSQKDNINMSYISVPILGQYEITPNFFAETGPEVSFNLSAKLKDKDTKKVYDWNNFTKKVYFSWAIGTGYYFTDNLGVNLRANIGLGTPFVKYRQNVNVDGFNHINFQLGVIYLF